MPAEGTGSVHQLAKRGLHNQGDRRYYLLSVKPSDEEQT